MSELREKVAAAIRDHEICSGADSGMGLHYELADCILAIPRIQKALRYYDAMRGLAEPPEAAK